MTTCAWCKTSGKTLTVDHEGVCPACRKAARYPDRPMNSYKMIRRTGDGDNYILAGGRHTCPVWNDNKGDE